VKGGRPLLQLTRRYLRQIDGIFLALCAACSVLSVVTLVSIGHNQLGSINNASVQFIASALGILLGLDDMLDSAKKGKLIMEGAPEFGAQIGEYMLTVAGFIQ